MRQMTFVSPFQSPFVKPFPSEAVVAAAFDPLTLSPAIWYAFRDATTLYTDSGVTLVTADGDAVQQVTDKSGNGRYARQTTLASKPTYKTNIKNALSIVRTDGGDDLMSITSTSFSGDFTVFWVSNLTALGVAICGRAASTESIRLSVPGAIRFKVTTDTIVTTNSFTTGAWHIAALRRASGALTGYKNATDITTGSPSNSETLVIDTLFEAGSFSRWPGDTGEFIIFPSALSASDMTSMWTYLNNLWAVY